MSLRHPKYVDYKMVELNRYFANKVEKMRSIDAAADPHQDSIIGDKSSKKP